MEGLQVPNFSSSSAKLVVPEGVASGNWMLLLAGAVSITVVAMTFLSWSWSFSRLKFPRPKSYPIIGALPTVLREGVFECLQKWVKELGDVYCYRMGPVEVVVLTDPDVAVEVMTKKYKDFRDRPAPETLFEGDDRGLLFSKGKYWTTARSAVFPLFHVGEQLESYVSIMNSSADKLSAELSKMGPDQPFDLQTRTAMMAMDVFARVCFGNSLDRTLDIDAGKLVYLVEEAIQCMTRPYFSTVVQLFAGKSIGRAVHSVMELIPGTMERHRRDLTRARERIGKTILQARPEEAGDGAEAASNGTKMDLLGLLMRAQKRATEDPTRVRLTDSDLVVLVAEMITGGSDSTANTLLFAIFLLCTHPHVEQKLAAEIKANFEQSPPDTLANLDKYPYAHMVIKEVLRIFPTVTVTGRVAEEDVRIGGDKQWLIPRGQWILIPIIALHRSPRNFYEPEVFRPERFDPTSEFSTKDPRPSAYVPFGMGPRMCPGYKFGLQEAVLSLIRLYARHTFTLAPSSKLAGLQGQDAVRALELIWGVVPKLKHGLQVTVGPRT